MLKENRLKILYHHRTQAQDAQGVHIRELAKAFREIGHTVEFVALVDGKSQSRKGLLQEILSSMAQWVPNWLYECMGLVYNLYGYRMLCRAIREKNPDLIYERYSLNTFCGIFASRQFGRPLVLEVNAPLSYEQAQLGKLSFGHIAKFLERWVCSHSTWTVVVSGVLKEMLEHEGVPREKMVVIPNGIDPEIFSPYLSGEKVRQRYALEESITLGFVGWFRPWHGLEMLLEIMYEACLAKRGVRLLLIGDGPAFKDLYQYTKNHALSPVVTFTGPIQHTEIAAHIAAMDIAIQPSAPAYACPMKIVEYMGMGKCIVAPDQPNVRELLEPGVTGALFPPGDKMGLQRALIELVENPGKRTRLGQQAYEKLKEQGLLWTKNAEKVISLLSLENQKFKGSFSVASAAGVRSHIRG